MPHFEKPVSIPGMTLGRYHLLQRIGQGGMGEVWLGEDPRLHRQVAIKTLPLHNQGDREFLQRFEREARAAAALIHPHILSVHDYGQQALPNGQTITYIVMPYISGGSLEDRIAMWKKSHTYMPHDEAIAYLSQAAEAIDYAHAQGILRVRYSRIHVARASTGQSGVCQRPLQPGDSSLPAIYRVRTIQGRNTV